MAESSLQPSRDPLRAAKIGAFVLVLLIGWVFVLWSNRFHVTAPVVFVCLGYLAVISTVANLWRTGAAVVAAVPESEAWARPIGARGELDKEKRTLLKAIKEAEFDLAMGKLSKADSDALIRGYRARAIEVIKALDQLEAGAVLSPKEQIAREVKARLELAASDKPSKRAKNAAAQKAEKAEEKAAKAEAKVEKAEEKADTDLAAAVHEVPAGPNVTLGDVLVQDAAGARLIARYPQDSESESESESDSSAAEAASSTSDSSSKPTGTWSPRE